MGRYVFVIIWSLRERIRLARENASEFYVIPNIGYDEVVGAGLALNAHARGAGALENIKSTCQFREAMAWHGNRE